MGTTPRLATHEELLAEAGWLRALAQGLVASGPEAEDATQDTLVAALEHAPRADRPLRPWLARVLTNRVRRQRRDASTRAALADVDGASGLPSPEELVQRVELQQRVVRAVLELDESSRTCILLHYFHGLPAAEIATRTNATPTAVRQRLRRARERLRDKLDEQCEGRAGWFGLMGALAATRQTAPSTWKLFTKGVLTVKFLLGGIAAVAFVAAAWTWGDSAPGSERLRGPASPGGRAARSAPAEELASTLAAQARVPRAVPQVVADEPTGSVLVVVRTADAVPSAVAFVESRARGVPWPVLDYLPTDGEGRARFEHVPVGDVKVGLLRTKPRTVEVRADSQARVEFELDRGIDVELLVVDDAGRTVADADVWLSESVDVTRGDVRHGPAARPVRGASVAQTDGDGRAVLLDVRAEQWVAARKPGVGVAPLRPILGAPAGRLSLRLVLARGVTLGGSVVDGEGRPVPDASVSLTAGDGTRTSPTDRDGRFALSPVVPGRAELLVRAAGFAPRHRSVDVTGDAELSVRLEPPARVAGRVLDVEGRPVEDAVVRWTDVRLATLDARSDAQGRFELVGLPAGTVKLEAAHAEAGRAEGELELVVGSETRWDPRLRQQRRLHGRIVDGDGRPLGGWEVAARPEGTNESHESITATRRDGSFELSPVAELLRVHVYPAHAWGEFPARVLRDVDPSDPLELVVAGPDPATGSLAGIVVGPRGDPGPGALVGVWHQVHKIWRGARPGPDGRFLVANVPAGDVTVQVEAESFPAVGLGEPSVEPGEVVDLGTVRLVQGGVLRVVASGLSEEVARGVRVEIDGGGLQLGVGLTRSGREFRSELLPPGRFDVHVEGDFVESLTVQGEVIAGRESTVRVPLRPAGMRVLRLEAPAGHEWPFAIEAELFAAERRVWNAWATLDSLEPVEFRVSAVPGSYRLVVRDRYAEPPARLYLGPFEITGFEGQDPPVVATLRPPD